MKRVLWRSKHIASVEQLESLKKFLKDDDITVMYYRGNIDSVEQIINEMRKWECDEIVAVIPHVFISQLISAGITPIKSVMRRHDGETEFIGFKRIVKFDITLEDE